MKEAEEIDPLIAYKRRTNRMIRDYVSGNPMFGIETIKRRLAYTKEQEKPKKRKYGVAKNK